MKSLSSGRAPRQSAATREAGILAGAVRVFAEASFAQTDTAELAAAAGVSPAALYRYFPSKRDLYVATLRDAGPRLLALWRQARDTNPDPAGVIWDIGMAYYDHIMNASPFLKLWFQALGEASDPDIRALVAETLGGGAEIIAGVIRDGQAAGEFRADLDARAEAWRFMGIGFSMNVTEILGFTADYTRADVERWGRHFIDSLRTDALHSPGKEVH